MKQKVLAATVAGGLVVGSGFIGAAVTSPAAALAQEDKTEDESVRSFHHRGALLEEVLADLVETGTIEQSQADAIVTALNEKAEELKEERRANRNLIRGFLLDGGGIDAEEWESLPDNHLFSQIDVSEYLEDGVVSIDELREIRRSLANPGDAA